MQEECIDFSLLSLLILSNPLFHVQIEKDQCNVYIIVESTNLFNHQFLPHM